jgi:hypothetical protein
MATAAIIEFDIATGQREISAAQREALADTVIGAFAKLAEHREDVARLWCEFEGLKKGETIKACHTKTEFCSVHLGRTMRTIQYMLNGGNPQNGREIISPKHKPKRKPKEWTHGEHEAASNELLRNEVRAYCAKMRKDPEYKTKLETFFREITEGLGVVVEVHVGP